MKLNAQLTSDDTLIDLAYDEKVRLIFGDFAAVALPLCEESSIRRLLGKPSPDILSNLAAGAEVIECLGFATHSTGLPTDGAFHAFTTATFVGYFAQRGPKSLLALGVDLLAQMTPLTVVLPKPLPPAAEVFDSDSVARDVWNEYERLRVWKKPRNPMAFIATLEALRIELSRITGAGPGIKAFVLHLDFRTTMYRDTLARLGVKENAPAAGHPESD